MSFTNKISEWLTRNKLQHHSTKTKVMIIGSTHNLRNKVYDPTVTLNGKFIFECVAVLLDEKLSWEEHIEKIYKKVEAGIAVRLRCPPQNHRILTGYLQFFSLLLV